MNPEAVPLPPGLRGHGSCSPPRLHAKAASEPRAARKPGGSSPLQYAHRYDTRTGSRAQTRKRTPLLRHASPFTREGGTQTGPAGMVRGAHSPPPAGPQKGTQTGKTALFFAPPVAGGRGGYATWATRKGRAPPLLQPSLCLPHYTVD